MDKNTALNQTRCVASWRDGGSNIWRRGIELKMEGTFGSLAPFDCSEPSKWKAWKRAFSYCVTANDVTDSKRQVALLLHLGGPELQEVYHAIVDEDVKVESLDKAIEILDSYFLPKRNVTYERHVFHKESQKPGEPIDVFVTRLRKLVKTCEYGAMQNDMIRDQLIDRCHSHRLRCNLLREQNLTLETALSIARSIESADRQADVIEGAAGAAPASAPVDVLQAVREDRASRKAPRGGPAPPAGRSTQPHQVKCFRCGRSNHRADDCVAVGRKCFACRRIGHFQNMCPRPRRTADRVQVVSSEADVDSDIEDHVFSLSSAAREGSFPIQVGQQVCDALVDSGATCNVMSETTFRSMFRDKQLLASHRRLFAYGSGTPMHVVGHFKTTVSFGDVTVADAVFYVIPGSHKTLLGKATSEEVGLLRVGPDVSSVAVGRDPTDKYPMLFSGLGKLKDFHLELHIDPDVQPVAQRARRIPVALQQAVEKKLEELLQQEIIEKVSGPTPWVSPIVCAPKKNGDIRLCVDMRRANTAVRRERHPMPTIDDVLHEMTGAATFSKLDLTQSFHQIELDEKSRFITTFATHKGLYRYRRLMFGISCAPEIHQRVIQQVLADCEGARNIADDIVVFGSTVEEHDRRLDVVLQRLMQAGLTLNKEKCRFRLTELVFMGHHLSGKGVTAANEKVAAVLKAREPSSPAEVRSFLGLVNFLGRFIPDLSTVAAPLRELTRSAAEWRWDEPQRNAFVTLKKRLSQRRTLAYFQQHAETELVVDASPVGLGAVLLQKQSDGMFQPVEYASRSLTDVEQRYSQTEREALAVVWGCERFRMYLYGIDFVLVTDHKPLEVMFSPSSKPPARVERWVLRLQPYRYTVRHVSGPRNIADCLSRLTQERVPAGSQSSSEDYIRFVSSHAIPAALKKTQIQEETRRDAELQAVMGWLQGGRPDGCPRPYQSVSHELCMYDGMVLRGHRLVIPAALRRRVLQLAHEGHQGIVRTKQRLRSKVWWPGVDKDVEHLIRACHPCQVVSAGNPPDPVVPSELPSGPWQDVSLDLCGPFPTGESLLVVIDRYSRWVEVETMQSTTSSSIIANLKQMFARLGFPVTMTTDNARNLTSPEFEEFCEVCQIRHLTVTPLWPQANGLVERQNRTLLKAIRASVAEQRDWRECLQSFLLAYRSTPHPSTGKSPAELIYGRQLRTKLPEVRPPPAPGRKEVKLAHDRSGQRGKLYADRHRHSRAHSIDVGEKVLVRVPRKCNKLSAPFFREPYTVVAVNGSQLIVKRPEDGKLFKRNSSFCKKYVEYDVPTDLGGPLPSTQVASSTVPAADGYRTRGGRLVRQPDWYGVSA